MAYQVGFGGRTPSNTSQPQGPQGSYPNNNQPPSLASAQTAHHAFGARTPQGQAPQPSNSFGSRQVQPSTGPSSSTSTYAPQKIQSLPTPVTPSWTQQVNVISTGYVQGPPPPTPKGMQVVPASAPMQGPPPATPKGMQVVPGPAYPPPGMQLLIAPYVPSQQPPASGPNVGFGSRRN